MKNTIILVTALVLLATSCQESAEKQKIDLSGTWKYALDPYSNGVSEAWFNQDLKDTLTLPGSLTSNGIGNDITLKTPWVGQIVDSSFFKNPKYAKYREHGNIKIPFWLQPIKYYKGIAWYQKEIIIPEDWKDKYVNLFLERCHWESRLWVDGKEIGMCNSLGTPHQYNLRELLTPGRHKLTLCVDNRVKDIDPGVNSHSISDHTQTNWNGIVGQMYLEAHPAISIQNMQVYPNVQKKEIVVKLKVQNPTGKTASVKLNLKVAENAKNETQIFELIEGENNLDMTLPMGDKIELWSEFNPNIYSLKASLTEKATGSTDVRTTSFGMREFKTNGNHITINGNPVFLRGTLECCIFPETGYPPTDIQEWLRIFKICRAHGLNHMRFHSWCPPQAAFDAADQSGFYLQVECSSWANQSTTLGDRKPFDNYLFEESERMIEQYGNHPSFCMMAYGNEPGGSNHVSFLTGYVKFLKGKDSRHIYTSGAGWPNLNVNDYLSLPNPRIQAWGEGLNSIINGHTPNSNYDWSDKINKFSQPVVSHEIGQWCVYPDFKEIAQYKGVVRAKNFEIFQETLKENGMEQLADSFLLASGKLQALCYKAEIEAALRTQDFGGFQLLDLHDFPGQGTALVGVLNSFWGEKGYISPAEYSRFCNVTVPLARIKKLVFTNNETFDATVEVAHFGEKPINNCVPEWKISDRSGKVVQKGKLPQTNIPLGNAFSLGKVSFALDSVAAPEKLTLEVSIDSFANSWDFWVYPAKNKAVPEEEKIRMAQKLDAQTAQYLNNGGTVLLNLKKGALAKEMGGDIEIGFSSIFWNTAWTHGQAPHTLGILCDPKNAALAEFPTEYHSNFQWWDAMSHSGAIDLSSFSPEIAPIIRVIDDWVTNRPLALVFEAKVGKGKILISGIDLTSDLDKRPAAQQLLFSLKKYMVGEKFNPKVELTAQQIKKLTKS